MWFWRAALWKQLAIVWAAAFVVDAVLFAWQFRRPLKVFWLIPSPDWRLIWPSVAPLFRDYPVLGLALVVVPLVTLALTIGLILNRVVPIFRHASNLG